MMQNTIRSVAHVTIEKGRNVMKVFDGFVDKIISGFLENDANNELLEVLGLRTISNQLLDSNFKDTKSLKIFMRRYCSNLNQSWIISYTYADLFQRLVQYAIQDDKIDELRIMLFGNEKISKFGVIHTILSGKGKASARDCKIQSKYLEIFDSICSHKIFKKSNKLLRVLEKIIPKAQDPKTKARLGELKTKI